jgi:two-component system chemotaxis response regulator CheB
MDAESVVVIGGSAGALPALEEVLARTPRELPAAVFVVVHIGASSPSHLAEILQRKATMPVSTAVDGEAYRAGYIYVGPPDQHLLLEDGRIRLSRGPKENRFRPALDALFRSAAVVAGPRAIAVVLSGVLDDGTAGAWWVKDRGGAVIVQHPDDAQFDPMPRSVLEHVGADHAVPASAIGPLLARLVTEKQASEEAIAMASKELELEVKIAAEGRALQLGVMDLGPISPYTCPECHGVLVQLKGGGIPRFRCHTGHAYSISTLLADVTAYIESSLWNALRAIEEASLLYAHEANALGEGPSGNVTRSLLAERSVQASAQAELVRQALDRHQRAGEDDT